MKVTRVEMRDIVPSAGVQQAMEQQMTAEQEKRAAILRSEGRGAAQRSARSRGGLVLDAKAQKGRCCWRQAQSKQQEVLAEAKAKAGLVMADALQANQPLKRCV